MEFRIKSLEERYYNVKVAGINIEKNIEKENSELRKIESRNFKSNCLSKSPVESNSLSRSKP